MKKQVEAKIPTPWGEFKMVAYADSINEYNPQLAMSSEQFDPEGEVLVRIHSECMTGDVFGSKRCDCGQQLHQSLELISNTNGLLIYLRQEGRGIGLINKLKAYNLQDEGVNTKDANVHLGFEPDQRTYEMAIAIMKDLGIKKIRLLTNNPDKIEIFKTSEIQFLERIPLEIKAGKENIEYLEAKRDFMGHLLSDL